MVPLEFVNNIMSKEAASDNNESLYSKPVDLQAPYIDMPPSAVMKMKKDLIVHTTTISELEDQVYRKNNE